MLIELMTTFSDVRAINVRAVRPLLNSCHNINTCDDDFGHVGWAPVVLEGLSDVVDCGVATLELT